MPRSCTTEGGSDGPPRFRPEPAAIGSRAGPPVDGGAATPSLAQDGTPTATLFPLTPSAFSYLPHIAHNPSPADTRTPVPSTLTPTSAPPTPTATEAPSTTLTIQGAVQSCQGVFIQGATVTLEGTGQSATTGSDGRYRIGPIAGFLGGDYVLTASAAGYAPRSLPLTLPDTGVRTVSFAGVNCLQALPTATITPTALPAIVFSDNVENGMNGWTVSHNGGSENWQIVDADAHSQSHSWFAEDQTVISDMYLISPPITIGSDFVMSFWHRYILGYSGSLSYDGGVVEISTNDGATWTDLGSQIIENGYNRTIDRFYGSPIGGRQAFSADSQGWLQTRVNLSSYAGQRVRIRFREASITTSASGGWWIDDLVVGLANAISVATPTPTIALAWTGAANMPTAREMLGVVATQDGTIYAIGGCNDGRCIDVSTVEKYDPTTNTWQTRANMPTARAGLGVAVVNGKIYAIGGGYNRGFSTVEEYDPITNTWAARASMPTPRYNLAVAVLEGKVYAIGGSGAAYALATVEVFDPIANEWTTKASLPSPSTMLVAVTANNGRIYAIGGEERGDSPNRDVYEYNPVTNSWRTRANMIFPRQAMAGVLGDNGKIYVMGGAYGLKYVEEYDPVANVWVRAADLSTGRGYLGAAKSRGRVYTVGGEPEFSIEVNVVEVAALPQTSVQQNNSQ